MSGVPGPEFDHGASRDGGGGRGYGEGLRGRGSYGGGGRDRRPGGQQDGDWPCPNSSCGNVNFAKRMECYKCGTPKPGGFNQSGNGGFRPGSNFGANHGGGYGRGSPYTGIGQNDRGFNPSDEFNSTPGHVPQAGCSGGYESTTGRGGHGFDNQGYGCADYGRADRGTIHDEANYGKGDKGPSYNGTDYGKGNKGNGYAGADYGRSDKGTGISKADYRQADKVLHYSGTDYGRGDKGSSYGGLDYGRGDRGPGYGGPNHGRGGGAGFGQGDAHAVDHYGGTDPSYVKQCDESCGDTCDNSRIYVSGLPLDVTTDELRELFGGIGQVARIKQKRGYKDQWPWNIKIYTDEAGNSKGDAVLSYEDPSAAHSAGGFFNDYSLRGHTIKVTMAEKYAARPGGGRGGDGGYGRDRGGRGPDRRYGSGYRSRPY